MLNFTPSSLEQDLTLQHTGCIGCQFATRVYCEEEGTLCVWVGFGFAHTHTHTSLLTDIQIHKHQTVWRLWFSACQLNSFFFFSAVHTFTHITSHTEQILIVSVSVGPETATAISLSLAWFLAFLENRELSGFEKKDKNHHLFWCQLKWKGTWICFLSSNAA